MKLFTVDFFGKRWEGLELTSKRSRMDGSVRVIDLDGVERNVEGIKWNTTVEEVLCKSVGS